MVTGSVIKLINPEAKSESGIFLVVIQNLQHLSYEDHDVSQQRGLTAQRNHPHRGHHASVSAELPQEQFNLKERRDV